jgi:hypothetical protein
LALHPSLIRALLVGAVTFTQHVLDGRHALANLAQAVLVLHTHRNTEERGRNKKARR